MNRNASDKIKGSMCKLEQRKLFVKKSFELGDNGLMYKVKDLTSSVELEIPYEEIGVKRIDQNITNNFFLLFTIFMFFAAGAKIYFLLKGDHTDYIFTAVVIGVFFLSCLIAYNGNRKSILIDALHPPFIEFYAGRPDRESVEKFITELRLRTKTFLIKKYAERDRNIPIETQLEAINVLKNRNIITQSEYIELINNLTKPNSNPIGFGANN